MAVKYLTCWNSFPGIGSDGLRMNRLFAWCEQWVCLLCSGHAAKILLLWVSLLLYACGSRWSEQLIHLSFIHCPGKLCYYRMWVPAVRFWDLDFLLWSGLNWTTPLNILNHTVPTCKLKWAKYPAFCQPNVVSLPPHLSDPCSYTSVLSNFHTRCFPKEIWDNYGFFYSVGKHYKTEITHNFSLKGKEKRMLAVFVVHTIHTR